MAIRDAPQTDKQVCVRIVGGFLDFREDPKAWFESAMRGETGVGALVERFDRRGTEPFELFRSEFGQNSGNFEILCRKSKVQKMEKKKRK